MKPTRAADIRADRDRLLALLEQALNGWACYATSSRERDDIARIRAAAGRQAAPPLEAKS